jgi:general nucleoside transport system permease protein
MARAPETAVGSPPPERSEWLERVLGEAAALLIASGIALVAGAVIIAGYGENPLDVYAAILRFSFTATDGLAYVLAISTPLIFSALAVCVCFKAGLFNIGVEGQYLVAMVVAAWAALNLDFLPGPLLMWAVLLFAMLGGIAWAAIPAILKVRTGAHEVVTTIMLNGASAGIVGWALPHPLRYSPPGATLDVQTAPFPDAALVPDLGHLLGFGTAPHLSWLFVLALVAAGLVWFLLRRTRLGYEARAVGASAGSARAGGIRIGSIQVKMFAISGALAGLIGMQQILADKGYFALSYEALLGFSGIAVAFLARNNPIGIVFAAFLWGVLSRGELALQLETTMPREFIIILQGMLILSVVITYEVARRRLQARQLRREAAMEAEPPAAPRTAGLAPEAGA